MIEWLLDKPVSLLYERTGPKDAYGQPSKTNETLPGMCYYSLVATDDADALSRQQLDVKVYLPVVTDTFQLRAVEINGDRYDVQGTPFKQWNPRLSQSAFWVLSVRRAVS